MRDWTARVAVVIQIFTAVAVDRWLSTVFPSLMAGPFSAAFQELASLALSAIATVLIFEFALTRPRLAVSWIQGNEHVPYASATAHLSFHDGQPPFRWEVQVSYVARSLLARIVTWLINHRPSTVVVCFEPEAFRCAKERQSAPGIQVRRREIRFPLSKGLGSGTLSWATFTLEPLDTPGAMTVKCSHYLESGQKRLRLLSYLVDVNPNVREFRLVRSN